VTNVLSAGLVRSAASQFPHAIQSLNSQDVYTMIITFQAPEALKPDPGNARTHSAKQVAQICASITAFGFTNPILLTPDLDVIAGHGRLGGEVRQRMRKEGG
jgi:hypothetical protein